MTRTAASTPVEPNLTTGLFPPSVLAASARVDPADEAHLFAEERLLVASAAPKRRREFASARCLAHALLAQLGAAPGPLGREANRAPIWPVGIVGSISHCDERVAVAVAHGRDHAGVGIDIEPDVPIESGLWSRICTPTEIARLDGSDENTRGRTVRLLFSAKEALYKCVHPHAQRFIGFQEAEILLQPEGRFAASLPDDVSCALPVRGALTGRLVRREGWILTGMSLPGVDAPPGAVRKTR